MSLDTQICPLCDGTLQGQDEVRDLQIGSRTAAVLHRFYRCDSCGEQLYTPGQMATVQMLASDKIRDEEGLLRSSQIHTIRTRLGLTQHQFEQLLGVGPKTVVRWEKGTVFQNGATDSLLRVVSDVPGTAQYLAGLHKVDLDADAQVDAPMRDEYDFRGGIRGKYTRHRVEG